MNLMAERGPIRYRDGIEGEYLADFVPVEKKVYLYGDAFSILDEWFKTHPEKRGLRDKLRRRRCSSRLPVVRLARRLKAHFISR